MHRFSSCRPIRVAYPIYVASRNVSWIEGHARTMAVTVPTRLGLLLHENPDNLFETTSAEIGGKHYCRPLGHVAGERIGGAEPQNLVPDYDLPHVDNESDSK